MKWWCSLTQNREDSKLWRHVDKQPGLDLLLRAGGLTELIQYGVLFFHFQVYFTHKMALLQFILLLHTSDMMSYSIQTLKTSIEYILFSGKNISSHATDPSHMDSYFLPVMEHLWLLSLTFRALRTGTQGSAGALVLGSSGMTCLTTKRAQRQLTCWTAEPQTLTKIHRSSPTASSSLCDQKHVQKHIYTWHMNIHTRVIP